MHIKGLVAWLAVIAASAGPTQASAAAARTFVSGKGSDSSACTITAPCRSFAQALSQTAPGGEIVALDAAGYGPVTISQSVSIVNDGVGTVSISVPPNGTGVTINAGASDTVHLRGIDIDGSNGGTNGVQINTVGTFEMLNCVVRHLQIGVTTTSGLSDAAGAILKSHISDNSMRAIYLKGSRLKWTLDTVDMVGNASGVYLDADTTTSLVLKHSSITGTSTHIGNGAYTAGGRLIVTDSLISSYYNGLEASGAAGVVGVDKSTVTNNSYGLYNAAGIVFTYQNNAINYNTTADAAGTITHYAPE